MEKDNGKFIDFLGIQHLETAYIADTLTIDNSRHFLWKQQWKFLINLQLISSPVTILTYWVYSQLIIKAVYRNHLFYSGVFIFHSDHIQSINAELFIYNSEDVTAFWETKDCGY